MSISPADPTPSPAEPQQLVQQGLAASQADDVARALDLFQRAADSAPGWAVPPFLLGSEYASAGEYDKAEAAMARAVVLDAGFHIARYQLGLLQYSSNRPEAALVTWQPLLAQPDLPWLSRFVEGFAALARGDIAGAQGRFAEGLTTPGVDPAVAGDIQRVLDGLAASAPADAPQQPAADVAHVLVSAYGKYNLH